MRVSERGTLPGRALLCTCEHANCRTTLSHIDESQLLLERQKTHPMFLLPTPADLSWKRKEEAYCCMFVSDDELAPSAVRWLRESNQQ